MNRVIVNLVAFQVGWFACVLGAANGYPLLGPLMVFAVVMLHIGLAARPRRELALIAFAGVLGALFDSAIVRTGWIAYANGTIWVGIAPYWIIAMWLSFATTLNVSLRWLRNQLWIGVGLGAIGGPVSYLAGEQLGALQLIQTSAALAALAVGWALFIPGLILLSERLDGVQAPSTGVPQHG